MLKRVGLGVARALVIVLLVYSFLFMCVDDAFRNLKHPISILEIMVFFGALLTSIFIFRGCWRQLTFWARISRILMIILMIFFCFVIIAVFDSGHEVSFSTGFGYLSTFLFLFIVVCYQFTPPDEVEDSQ